SCSITSVIEQLPLKNGRISQNAKYFVKFCETCEETNQVSEQVQYKISDKKLYRRRKAAYNYMFQ
ncbi:MAG: hypothetical protein LBO80_10250, partial [Treponema sp.]|nr:hypothetical protein [Treponema sp.]